MARRKGTNSLKTLLTRDRLFEMAGLHYFSSGEDYVCKGYVHDLAVHDNRLTARVSGTQEYYVELLAEDDELVAVCSCPLGADDMFCNHCVAVGLTWLNNPATTHPRKKGRSANQSVSIKDIESFLKQQQKSTLIQWMLERTNQDKDWKQHLVLKVASQHPQRLDINTFQQALHDAISIRGFIEWKKVSGYTERIDAVLDTIKNLLEDYPQAVIELCQYATPLLEKALNSVDDSSGAVGNIMLEFQDLHYKACKLAPPDPAVLAKYLLNSELESGFGGFDNAVETYATILGEEGIEHYRKLAESMWQEFPNLSSKNAGDRNFKRGRLQFILETLAKAKGDVEALIAIKKQDLSNARSYLDIAQLYLQNGQRGLALEWAESGLNTFERTHDGLTDFVVDEYFHLKRNDDALALLWKSFTQSVSLKSYQKLNTQAARVKQRKIWRDKALAHIRHLLEPPKTTDQSSKVAQNTRKSTRGSSLPGSKPSEKFSSDHSLLVEIFLCEGEDDLAWQEAQAGGCSNHLWLQLAERRQISKPEDAIPIYLREIEPLIKQTHNAAYENAVAFLKKVHRLMNSLNRQAEFDTLVAHLRKNYKAKRNFIVLLNKQRW